MNNNPWELLDIDDSDLPSFVCPSNLSSFSSTTLTPSPTGVVQAIMMNQKSRKPLPTQEFKMCAHQVFPKKIVHLSSGMCFIRATYHQCSGGSPTR
ncbi:hypothetical protein JHK85_051552 [Glycine max]|nr:hypothetical protein JHK85_051552 [Glycine max]